jgi:hypothetical protein
MWTTNDFFNCTKWYFFKHYFTSDDVVKLNIMMSNDKYYRYINLIILTLKFLFKIFKF